MLTLRILAFAGGLLIVYLTLSSAVRTFVLPRGAPDAVSAGVFSGMRWLFALVLHGERSYRRRDRVMAYYAPLSLLALLVAWLALVALGYTCLFWGAGLDGWLAAFSESGSSLLTLGFAGPENLAHTLLSFSEAAIGLILIALLIAYLPTIYSAFARREAAVALLEVRAGTPPSAVEMLQRYHRIHGMGRLNEVWRNWELWFADIEESHTSLAVLALFRSPQPDRSWVTAAGAVLDAATLANAALDIPHDPQADLCIRAGYLALRAIADFFGIKHNAFPRPDDPTSIRRSEFDAVLDELSRAGLAIKPDREQAWHDFNGWRVNYDTVLITLADLTMAPYAPWSTDRKQAYRPVPVHRRTDAGSRPGA